MASNALTDYKLSAVMGWLMDLRAVICRDDRRNPRYKLFEKLCNAALRIIDQTVLTSIVLKLQLLKQDIIESSQQLEDFPTIAARCDDIVHRLEEGKTSDRFGDLAEVVAQVIREFKQTIAPIERLLALANDAGLLQEHKKTMEELGRLIQSLNVTSLNDERTGSK